MKICVFCSSSDRVGDDFKLLGKQVGRKIAENGHTLVYGGATGGLMDAVAEGATEKNGEIIGIISEIIIRANRLSALPTQMIVATDMNERKKRMKEIADVFLVLPGGYGTLDEMMDVIASGSVGEHRKPLICLNHNGVYDSLINLSKELKSASFIPKEESYKPIFVKTVEEWYQTIKMVEVMSELTSERKIAL